jgi:hypothetical protein
MQLQLSSMQSASLSPRLHCSSPPLQRAGLCCAHDALALASTFPLGQQIDAATAAQVDHSITHHSPSADVAYSSMEMEARRKRVSAVLLLISDVADADCRASSGDPSDALMERSRRIKGNAGAGI